MSPLTVISTTFEKCLKGIRIEVKLTSFLKVQNQGSDTVLLVLQKPSLLGPYGRSRDQGKAQVRFSPSKRSVHHWPRDIRHCPTLKRCFNAIFCPQNREF